MNLSDPDYLQLDYIQRNFQISNWKSGLVFNPIRPSKKSMLKQINCNLIGYLKDSDNKRIKIPKASREMADLFDISNDESDLLALLDLLIERDAAPKSFNKRLKKIRSIDQINELRTEVVLSQPIKYRPTIAELLKGQIITMSSGDDENEVYDFDEDL
jgi:hypothetical protein